MNHTDWPLSAPINLTWEITRQCNLSCSHCLSSSGRETPGELEFQDCISIVDQLAALKVFEINFGGGEPLLKDYFLPLLDYIHEKGMVTCVSTNGTVLNDEAVARFTGNPLVNVQVSLDGATPEVNDRIRGQGTFQWILKGIELLANRDISLSINTVVTSINLAQLSQLKDLASSFGAKLRVSRFRPSGRGRATWEELRLTSRQLQKLSEWLNNDVSILTGDSFFSIASEENRRELGLNMCGAGKMTCCIDPFGLVYPCAFLQEDEFGAGNLRETPFKDIWDSAPVFKYFRELEPAACQKCPRYNMCHGGCPAMAHFVSKDINRPDPECLINWTNDLSAGLLTQ
jgi:mycofactocin radical SAM maturase